MRNVMITGATGFIGGRVAEILHDRGVPMVALVRRWTRAARLARLPVEMVHGDILEIASLRAAMRGCDVVLHCAADRHGGTRGFRRSCVVGTRHVLQAALEAGVERLVLLSSVSVYGSRPREGPVTEDEAVRYTGAAHADAQISAERVAFRYCRRYRLPVTILRAVNVYGPFSPWTARIVAGIRDGRASLVNDGRGICNCLYVDNLVDAMLLAAQLPVPPGEVFHVADGAPVPWRAFFEGHARALGGEYLPGPEAAVEAIPRRRARTRQARPSSTRQVLRLARNPEFRAALGSIPAVAALERAARVVGKSILPEEVRRRLLDRLSVWEGLELAEEASPPAFHLLPDPDFARLFPSAATFSIAKAQRVLKYEPRIAFQQGIARTAAWIQWARL